MSLHVVRETDAGIIVRGAKFETAAAYANLAYVKPTILVGAMPRNRITPSALSATRTRRG